MREASANSGHFTLTVKSIQQETADAKSFVLAPERAAAANFDYLPGQFLTFRIPLDGNAISRSYSLCTAPSADPDMAVCVKRVEGGRGSNWFNDQLIAGARIEALPPAGRFTLRSGSAPLFLIAGGSGITPCMGLLKHALTETDRSIKLVFANRDSRSIIFREALDRFSAAFPGRLTCEHWLDEQRGFMGKTDVIAAATGWELADIYICGPAPLMDMAEETLDDHLGGDGTVMTERFLSPDDDPPADKLAYKKGTGTQPPAARSLIGDFQLTLDGVTHTVPYSPEQTLLEAAQLAGIDVPFVCAEGHCGTCMGRLKSGEVAMASTQALSKRNIERGNILACQAKPISSAPIWLDFDF